MPDRTEMRDGTATTPPPTRTGVSLEFSDAELNVADIMTETIITVDPHDTVALAIQEMARYKISCIIVTTGGRAVGILTERDVLRGAATRYSDFIHTPIAEEMSKPVISVDPGTTALAASRLMTARNIKRLLIVGEQQPVGVVTQTDITSALISMSPFKNITDLMTRDVVTVDAAATMTDAAQLMAASNISCVVILRDGKAAGIVTEKDIVQHLAQFRDDPTATPVTEIMSFPVVTAPPTHSVMSASRMMHQMCIHRLLVGSATDIQGIVTQTDIIKAVRRKLKEAREARLQHQSEMRQLARSAMMNLSSIHCLFRGILCCQEPVGAPAKTPESPGDAPSDRADVLDRDQDEAGWRDRTLMELEAQISETLDTLATLAGISGVPTSRESVLP